MLSFYKGLVRINADVLYCVRDDSMHAAQQEAGAV